MMKWIYGVAALLIPLSFSSFAQGAEMSGDAIVAKVDTILHGSNDRYDAELTMIRPGKDTRTSKIRVYIKGTEKVFVRYLEPAQEKGMGYLRVGDDEWLYLPNAGRSIRVNGRQNMQGSDLNNDDILKTRLADDYAATVKGSETLNGEETTLLELKARDSQAAYGRLLLWVGRSDQLPVKIGYFAFSGKPLKTMTYERVRMVGGHRRPTLMIIDSDIRQGYRTIFSVNDADFDSAIDDGMFTKWNLEKGA